MPRASPPDNAGAFVSRRDRPEHQQRRAGTGRQITSRDFGVLGRHTGVRLQQTTKDLEGFDDLDQAWNSDNDVDQENAGAVQNRSSLFPESPLSMSTAPNEPEPAIAAKKLEFDGDQNEDQTADLPDSQPASESEPESEPEAPEPVKTKPVASRTKQNANKSSETVKKASKKGKSKSSPSEVAKKPSKKNSANEGAKKRKERASNKSRSSPLDKRLSPANISIENDENEEPVQDTVEDSGSFTEDETVKDSPVAEIPKQSKKVQSKQPKTKKAASTKTKRRQTLVIIDEAQQSGLLDEETMVIENDKLVRRSQRARCKPVAFFQCEQPNYIRGPGGLFTLDREKVVIKHVSTPPAPPARRIRQKRRRPKSWDESSDEEEELLPLFGETKVIGPNGKERRQIVAVRASDHAMSKITTKPPAGEKAQSKDLIPTVCKFEGLDRVSTGIIRIPASGQKYAETSSRTEVFFVASCERNSLLVKINNNEFKLSKGDTFMVPEKNSYTIKNVSGRKQADVFFSANRD